MACEMPHSYDLSLTHDSGYEVAITVNPGLDVARQLTLDLSVCKSGRPFDGTLQVDANMPAHGHGMNFTPEVSSHSNGRFSADGFMFHMPGVWQIQVELYEEGSKTRLSQEVEVGL